MRPSALLLAASLQLASSTDPRVAHLASRQTTWDPPSDLVKPLQEVWDHVSKEYSGGNIMAFKNYGYDILMASNGTLNFCVRWESKSQLTPAQRKDIANALQINVAKWTDHLTGFMGWPFSTIPTKIIGYATTNPSLILSPSSTEKIHTTVDGSGIAECDPRCGRFFHQDGEYSSCPGGAENRYDMSLWLTDGFPGGEGGDWGQRARREDFFENLEHPIYWLHEFGHTMALDDFYDWQPTGVKDFIMNDGWWTEIRPFDYWMMRDFWRHLKVRYNL